MDKPAYTIDRVILGQYNGFSNDICSPNELTLPCLTGIRWEWWERGEPYGYVRTSKIVYFDIDVPYFETLNSIYYVKSWHSSFIDYILENGYTMTDYQEAIELLYK